VYSWLRARALLRFKHEFRALQGLSHPNLISLGELLNESGRWFFTMELVRGVDFRTMRGAMPSRFRAKANPT
jgi:serine/threonine protein kinase